MYHIYTQHHRVKINLFQIINRFSLYESLFFIEKAIEKIEKISDFK